MSRKMAFLLGGVVSFVIMSAILKMEPESAPFAFPPYRVGYISEDTDWSILVVPDDIKAELRAEADTLLTGNIIREQWAVYPYESYLALRGEALEVDSVVYPLKPVYLLVAEADTAGALIYGGDGIGQHIRAVTVVHQGVSVDKSVMTGHLPDNIPNLARMPAPLPRRIVIPLPTGIPEHRPELTPEATTSES